MVRLTKTPLLLSLFLLAASFILVQGNREEEHPTFIMHLFRNGARGPLNAKGDYYWLKNFAKLTDVGKAQMFVLGVQFAKKYPSIKWQNTFPSKTKANAVPFDRHKDSMQFFLWGIHKSKEISDQDNIEKLDVTKPNFWEQYKKHPAFNVFDPAKDSKEAMKFRPLKVTSQMDVTRDTIFLGSETIACPKARTLMKESDRKIYNNRMTRILSNLNKAMDKNLTVEEAF